MSESTPIATVDLRRESPSQTRQYQNPATASEKQNEEARVTFDKTIGGHYRHGKTGYRRVGVLFLTWLDDDMHCKSTEVGTTPSASKSYILRCIKYIGGYTEKFLCDQIYVRDANIRNTFPSRANRPCQTGLGFSLQLR